MRQNSIKNGSGVVRHWLITIVDTVVSGVTANYSVVEH